MSYQARKQKNKQWMKVVQAPMEAVPIPYTLTDFGRAYLAQLRVEEGAAGEQVEADGSAGHVRAVVSVDSLPGV